MRLFYAITIDPSVVKTVKYYQHLLRNMSPHGRYTRKENFHITLYFVGERPIEDLPFLQQVLNTLRSKSFTLYCHGISSFKRGLYYLAIESHPRIQELYTSIATQLSHEAVDPHYTPHITLGRDINIDATSIVVQRFPIEVNRISLMESRRINGALTYSELAHVDLIKGE